MEAAKGDADAEPQGGEEPQDQHPSDEGVADDVSGNDVSAVSGDQGSTREDEQADRLREEFLEVLGEVRAGGEGNLEARKRPSCQGRRVDGGLLAQVDGLIAEVFDQGSGTSIVWCMLELR